MIRLGSRPSQPRSSDDLPELSVSFPETVCEASSDAKIKSVAPSLNPRSPDQQLTSQPRKLKLLNPKAQTENLTS